MSEKKQKAKPVPHNKGDRSKSFDILVRIDTGHLRERTCSNFLFARNAELHTSSEVLAHMFKPKYSAQSLFVPRSTASRQTSEARRDRKACGLFQRSKNSQSRISICFARRLPCNTPLIGKGHSQPQSLPSAWKRLSQTRAQRQTETSRHTRDRQL